MTVTAVLRRVVAPLVAVCVLASGAVSTAIARAPGDIAVVVNPGVPVDNLTRAELRRILLGDREFWPSGVRVTILVRAPIARERDAMVKDVCEMSEAQFRQHWIGKVFRAEIGSGPKIVYSQDSALEQVNATPGAITLVEAPIAAKNSKVLKIDGKAPGQPGYPLK